MSSSRGEHLIWFRPERIRTVTWGGDPLKPVIIGNNPAELSPRRSFAQWHQLVENTSEPWTPADLSVARLIGETVSDVVLQFRSVRMLIAQNQLEHATHQVEQAELPVIVSDAHGRILLCNDACEGLLPANHPRLQWIDDLPPLFAESDGVRRRLRDLLTQRGPWRAEVRLDMPDGSTRPLLLRADPVFSTPEVILGFVILFTDLTERKTAEAARSRFQENIIERQHLTSVRLDSAADLVFQNLLSSIVDNAQLAALEITDGVDLARMPEMLESVHSSVSRAAEVLEQLILHSSRTSKKKR